MKIAGVPVEFNVATIFVAIMALFPIPEIITRPFDSIIQFTTFAKSSVRRLERCAMASRSVSMVFFAKSIMVSVAINLLFKLWIVFLKECVIFKMTKLNNLNFIC